MDPRVPYPVRYRLTRPWAPLVDRLVREHQVSGFPYSEERENQAQDLVIHQVPNWYVKNRALIEDGRAATAAGSAARGVTIAHTEAPEAGRYYRFALSGAHIFCFNKDLTEQFVRSDVDQVPPSYLQLPFDAVYYQFMRDRPVDLAPDRPFVDGAYIFRTGNRLTVINSSDQRTTDSPWYTDTDAGTAYELHFDLDAHATMAGCIDHALERYFEEARLSVQVADERLRKKVERQDYAAESFQLQREALQEQVAVINDPEKIGLVRGQLQDAARTILRLVCNATFYATSCSEFGREEWVRGTPSEAVEKIGRMGSAKNRERAERDLIWAGFRKVQVFSLPNDGGPAGLGCSPDAHWRRGFWGLRACGEARKDRRLTWVRPCLVNAETAAEVVHGRIHTTGRLPPEPVESLKMGM